MADGYFHRVAKETPTRLWINNPSADEAEQALDAGAISCTTNPTFGARLVQAEPQFIHGIIDEVIPGLTDDDDAADRVVQRVTARLLARFLPLYERSRGTEGFVTIQSDPRNDLDARDMVDAALRYRALGPNFMAKIPVTMAGLEAIEALIPEGVPICATEVFGIDQSVAVSELYQRVTRRTGTQPPFYVTHITGIFDEYLAKTVERQGIAISAASLAWAGSTVARNQYGLIQARQYPATMLGGGARSTRHFTDFVGGKIGITINWTTAKELLEWDPPVVSRISVETAPDVLAELTARLPDFRRANTPGALPVEEFAKFGPVQLFRKNFIAGYERLLAEIAVRRRLLTPAVQ